MKTNWKPLTLIISLIFTSTSLLGSTLFLKDGSRLEGELVKIHEGLVVFQTQFAGVLEVDQALVSSLSSGGTLFLKTDTGEVLRGEVEGENDAMVVTSPRGSLKTDINEIVAAWPDGESDPVVVARESELKSQLRKWSYQVGTDISASSGNTEKSAASVQAKATLTGPNDELVLYGSYKYAESNDVRSEDEQKAGMRYTNYFTEKMGWFVRSELERDKFEQIEFRSTSAFGLSYRWLNTDDMKLETRAGISYRYESYFPTTLVPSPESESFPGLDFEIDYRWKFAKWGELTTTIGFIPSVDDFADYLIDHESGVNIPLASSDLWKLRIGLSNQYNSTPDAGREELDTSYFIRLIMDWK